MKCAVCDRTFVHSPVTAFILVVGEKNYREEGECCSSQCSDQWHKNREIRDACVKVWAVTYVDLIHDRITGNALGSITQLMNLVGVTVEAKREGLKEHSGTLYTKAEGERTLGAFENLI